MDTSAEKEQKGRQIQNSNDTQKFVSINTERTPLGLGGAQGPHRVRVFRVSYVVLCYVMLCCVVLCYVKLCYVMLGKVKLG